LALFAPPVVGAVSPGRPVPSWSAPGRAAGELPWSLDQVRGIRLLRARRAPFQV